MLESRQQPPRQDHQHYGLGDGCTEKYNAHKEVEYHHAFTAAMVLSNL